MSGFDVEAVRRDFPILERTFDGKPLVYLDSGATSQKPVQVIEAESNYYRLHNANAHRGIYALGEEATEAYEGARSRIARFFGVEDASRLVFTRGTTESINLVAYGWGRAFLGEGDEIVITEMEHHSNIVPWQMVAEATGATLRYIALTDDGLLDLSNLGELLNERTAILGVTAMSNALGTITPLRQRPRRTCPWTWTVSTWISWRSAATRCSARPRVAGCWPSVSSWTGCSRCSVAGT
jgi:cysteine desulfurase/selenocysteine lyase